MRKRVWDLLALNFVTACHIILDLEEIYNLSKEQLSIGTKNVATVRFLITVNKLLFSFNVDILFLLKLFWLKYSLYYCIITLSYFRKRMGEVGVDLG